MPAKNTGNIVYLVVDNEPRVILFIVFLDFLSCELLLRYAGILLGGGYLILYRRGHPAVASFEVNGMMPHQISALLKRRFDFVPSVIHHAHGVPYRIFWLCVLEYVEATDR